METQVRRQASSCVTCDAQCRIGTGFLQVIRLSPVKIIPSLLRTNVLNATVIRMIAGEADGPSLCGVYRLPNGAENSCRCVSSYRRFEGS